MAVEYEVSIDFNVNDNNTESKMDDIINTLKNMNRSTDETKDKLNELSNATKKYADALGDSGNEGKNKNKTTKEQIANLAILTKLAQKATSYIIDATKESADFIAVQTEFNSVFNSTNGELQKAQKFVDNYANALYLDSKEVESAMSTFKLFTSTLGITSDKAYEISENMTQLAYDMAAVNNVDVSTMANKLTSALGGQAKALRNYGIALDDATLQQRLNELGINRTVSSLSRAEKAQISYYQIMQQTAGQQGYLAKHLLTPANALKIVKTQFTLLARAIGNVFIPIMMAIIPVVVAVTKALTWLANVIAGLLGIDINFSEYTAGIEDITGGIADIGDEADETSGKIKNMLRDFDDLHIVDFGDTSGSSSGSGGIGGTDLEIPTQTYADWSKFLDDINGKLSIAQDYIIAIGTALATMTVAKKALDFLDQLGVLAKGSNTLLAALGFGIMVGSTYLLYKGIEKMLNGDITPESIAETLFGIIGLASGVRTFAKGLGAKNFGIISSLEFSLAVSFILTGYKLYKEGIDEKNVIKEIVGALFTGFGAGAVAVVFGAAPYVTLTISLVVSVSLLWKGLGDYTIPNHEGTAWGNAYSNAIAESAKRNKNIVGAALSEPIKQSANEIATTLEQNTSDINKYSDNTIKVFEDTGRIITSNTDSTTNNMIDKYKASSMSVNNSIESIRKNTDTSFTNIDDTINKKMSNVEKNITTSSINAKTEFAKSMESIGKDMADATDEIAKSSETAKKSLEDIGKATIKMPHFGIEWETSGALADLFKKIGLQGTPKIKVDWYANGGFPDKGELFIANERGPELVGTMGNRNVVANNSQITEGIFEAAYSGFRQALGETDFGTGDTFVYVGNKQLTDVVTKRQRLNRKKYGR